MHWEDFSDGVASEVYTDLVPEAQGHEELPAWMCLKGDLWWPSGWGYFRIPEGHVPPHEGAYLPASSWEPMIPEACLPQNFIQRLRNLLRRLYLSFLKHPSAEPLSLRPVLHR